MTIGAIIPSASTLGATLVQTGKRDSSDSGVPGPRDLEGWCVETERTVVRSATYLTHQVKKANSSKGGDAKPQV